MIRGLIFDMDGLLIDSERIVQRSWAAAGRDLGYPDIGEQIYHTIGFNRARRTAFFSSVYGKDFPHEAFAAATRERFRAIVAEEGMALKPGARALIDYAKARGYRLAVATSSSQAYATRSLQSAGVYDAFDGFVFGNMVAHSKPDPEIYRRAVAAVSLEPPQCIALEDAPSGIASACAAGLKAIMIPDLVQPDDETRSMAWKVYPSLARVIPLLQCLGAQQHPLDG